MLDTLTHERCEELLDQPFELRLEDDALSLVLISVDPLGPETPANGRRRAFSLLFRGPQEPLLRQMSYPLSHPDLGTLDIFLVPVSAGPEGTCYEAVFT